MPDLGPQLQHYAEQLPVGPLPPFTAVQRRQRRRRRIHAGLSGVAVLLVAGGTLLTAQAVTGPGGRTVAPLAAGPPPVQLTIDGVTVRRSGSPAINSVQAADQRDSTLLVMAGSGNRAAPSACYPWTDVRIVAQDDRTVTLAASTYVVPDVPGERAVCTSEGRPVGRFTLDLGVPLGDRQVVQDGRSVHLLLTNTLLHATTLPDGYAEPTVFEDSKPPGLVRTTYTGPEDGTYLEILEGPVDQAPTDPDRTDRVDVLERRVVRGHRAVVRQTTDFDDLRCLVWAETATTGVAVCSHGSPAPLSAAQLAAVAEGLVRDP